VYASSAAVYWQRLDAHAGDQSHDATNIYGASKMKMDELARTYMREHPDLRLVGLRYFNVYGPGEQHKHKYASMMWQLSLQMKAGKRPGCLSTGSRNGISSTSRMW